jgi:hypothetical protein
MVCAHLCDNERARMYFDRAAELAIDRKAFAGHIADVRRGCGL